MGLLFWINVVTIVASVISICFSVAAGILCFKTLGHARSLEHIRSIQSL
jgi:hypothetical protein